MPTPFASGRPSVKCLAGSWQVAQDTADWVMREMQSPQGGYYSSLDADSEHEEGKFYVWTPQQLRTLLSAEEYSVVEHHYGLALPANFEDHAWHLHVAEPLPHTARRGSAKGWNWLRPTSWQNEGVSSWARSYRGQGAENQESGHQSQQRAEPGQACCRSPQGSGGRAVHEAQDVGKEWK